jgi:hypothetical protein
VFLWAVLWAVLVVAGVEYVRRGDGGSRGAPIDEAADEAATRPA